MNVKTLCLGVLCNGEATGYDIKKHFESAFSHFFLAGYGSIYPALADLTADGLVTCTEEQQDGKPDRKIYRVTEAGREVFLTALAETPPSHKVRSEFMVLMYFAHMMTAERIHQVLNERLRDIDSDLSTIDSCLTDPDCDWTDGERFIAGVARAALGASADFIRGHRHTIEDDGSGQSLAATG